jgi:proprotein convertase P-domain-containing protein
VKRIVLLAAALLLVAGGAARAVTKNYSTGNIDVPIGPSLDRSLTVPDKGPVSFVRVAFRITAPDTSALAISLVSPQGTVVPLVTNRGSGADFGSEDKNCGGILTELDTDETTNPIAAGQAPFADGPYKAEGNLASFNGEDAKGKWTLRIVNGGKPARLQCVSLDISRAVPQVLRARKGNVAAAVSFTERNYVYEDLRLTITRAGRTALELPLTKVGCRDCVGSRPTAVKIRDLDGGDPEVLVDLYTGGAHCCVETIVLRWNGHGYSHDVEGFGNFGYKLVDLDHDGLPELSAFDERFIYTFTAYVFSYAPPWIADYRAGRLVNVTRRFPAVIEKNAAYALKQFAKLKKPSSGFDPRAFVAVYVADQYLLGRPDVAQKALADAVRRGVVYRGKSYLGSPAGQNFAKVLMKDLRQWGYVR